MARQNIKRFSWIVLGCAVLSWCIVGVLFWRINADESDYLTREQQSQVSSGQAQSAAVAHAAVVRSSAEASQANAALAVDPVAFATLVQSVAAASGASVQISDALPENISTGATGNATTLYAFAFAVQVDGSFSSVMRALQLLQTLPAPSSIEEVDLALSPGSGSQAASWQMNVRIHLVTTDNISS
jgi:hypothetical protein